MSFLEHTLCDLPPVITKSAPLPAVSPPGGPTPQQARRVVMRGKPTSLLVQYGSHGMEKIVHLVRFFHKSFRTAPEDFTHRTPG